MKTRKIYLINKTIFVSFEEILHQISRVNKSKNCNVQIIS